MKQKWKFIWTNNFFRAGAIVFTGNMSVNILNYIFTLFMGRMLDPSGYGTLVSLLGLFAVVTVTASALTAYMAHFVAVFQARGESGTARDFFRVTLHRAGLGGLVLMVCWAAILPWVSRFFHMPVWLLLTFALLFPVSLVSSTAAGTLQGQGRFVYYSVSSFIAAFGKLLLAVVFVTWGFEVGGVLAAILTGSVLSMFSGLSMVLHSFGKMPSGSPSRIGDFKVLAFFPVTFWTALLMVLYTNADIMLVKHFLTAEAAGQYSALATVGKLVIYGTSAFTTVLIPAVSAAAVRGSAGRKYLSWSILTALVMGVPLVTAFGLFPSSILQVMLGPAYTAQAPYLFLYGAGLLLGSLGTVLVTYFLALHDHLFLYPLGGIVVLQIALISLFHDSIAQIVYVMLICGTLYFLSMGLRYLLLLRQSSPFREMVASSLSKPSLREPVSTLP